jgi:hypothetical protein
MFNKVIYKRSKLTWHLILYKLLSLYFLHVILCLSKDVSALDKNLLIQTLSYFKFTVFLFFISLISIWNFSKISQYLLSIFIFVINLNIIVILFNGFDKFILFLLFQHCIFSYFYYLYWVNDLNIAAFNPNASPNDLYPDPLYKINCVVVDKISKKTCLGFITNWDQDTCFVLLKNDGRNLNKFVNLSIQLDGIDFSSNAMIVSRFNSLGIGLNLFKDNSIIQDNNLDWFNLYKILKERGITPKHLYT